MKHLKKFMLLVLAAALVLSTFAACGGDAQEKPQPSTSQEPSTGTEIPADLDFGGAVFTQYHTIPGLNNHFHFISIHISARPYCKHLSNLRLFLRGSG